VDQPVLEHHGPWTESAYRGLPHDGRVELVDGTLLVGPGASPQRARVIERVRAAVAAVLPDGLTVRGPVPLRLSQDCVLVPDLVVTAEDRPGADGDGGTGATGAVLDAAAALVVIEVVGSGHGAADRTFKPQLYARSRIPYSLLIDHDSPFAVADMIIGGRYHEYAHARGDERLVLEEPFVLDLDLAALTVPGSDEEPADQDPTPPTEALAHIPAETR
jgi:hypothetical protein